MLKRLVLVLMAIIITTIAGGCQKGTNDVTPSEQTDTYKTDEQLPQQTETIDAIQEIIKNMTLEEKIGQMVMVGIDGYTNDAHSTEMIENFHVGGFILFKNNIKNTEQAQSLINSLKDKNSNTSSIPLFFSVDEEGGRVSRMPDEFVKLPSNKVIGSRNNPDFSFEIGKVIGKEIRSLGFNMDFAPVLDVNSNPKNPVIGDRSFGNSAQLVSLLGVKTMQGLGSQNVISVVKHFPGHGDTSVDSHVGLPVVNNGMERLKKLELVPFENAIKNNADVIMVAHILLPKIDAQNPASFSKAIITDLLRNEMNYNGLVITDDLTMGAITKNYKIEDAAIKAVNAGSNIILVCHDYEKQASVIKALKAAVENGDIPAEKVYESVYKILSLKQKYELSDEKTGPADLQDINTEIKSVLNKYNK